MKKNLLLLVCVLALSGCATAVREVKVVEIKNVLIAPPDELLILCDVEAPPKSVDYVAASWTTKEDMLVKHSTAQMKNVFTCNKTISSLIDWKKQQLQLYKK